MFMFLRATLMTMTPGMTSEAGTTTPEEVTDMEAQVMEDTGEDRQEEYLFREI